MRKLVVILIVCAPLELCNGYLVLPLLVLPLALPRFEGQCGGKRSVQSKVLGPRHLAYTTPARVRLQVQYC